MLTGPLPMLFLRSVARTAEISAVYVLRLPCSCCTSSVSFPCPARFVFPILCRNYSHHRSTTQRRDRADGLQPEMISAIYAHLGLQQHFLILFHILHRLYVRCVFCVVRVLYVLNVQHVIYVLDVVYVSGCHAKRRREIFARRFEASLPEFAGFWCFSCSFCTIFLRKVTF